MTKAQGQSNGRGPVFCFAFILRLRNVNELEEKTYFLRVDSSNITRDKRVPDPYEYKISRG